LTGQTLFNSRLCHLRRRILDLYHGHLFDAPETGMPIRAGCGRWLTRQMILVYLGTIFKTPEQQASRENDKTEKIVTYVTLIVGLRE
jgi:hypothetical protein